MDVTREQWLGNFIAEIRPVFTGHKFPLPDKIRVTCGFPSKHARSAKKRRIGEHWSPKASGDGTHEIFISPVIDDPVEAIGVLVHELCHAATDGDGHQGRFPAAAKALLLDGKPTATVVGDRFKSEFGALIDSLGQYPHARLNVNDKPKQATRLLKACCPDCGYTIRVTQKWASVGLPTCPTDGSVFTL
jgi:hypothetical protein